MAFSNNRWQELLLDLDCVFTDCDRIILDQGSRKLLKDGNAISLKEAFQPNKLLRGYDSEGKMVALLKYDTTSLLWRHEILFTY